jgi:hypothetical protein
MPTKNGCSFDTLVHAQIVTTKLSDVRLPCLICIFLSTRVNSPRWMTDPRNRMHLFGPIVYGVPGDSD